MAKKTKASTKKRTYSRKKASPKTGSTEKAPSGKKGSKQATSTKTPGDEEVKIDRRKTSDRRKTPDRRRKSEPVAVERRKIERRAKVNRRRQIDPTTCERDYSAEEIEFMNALDDYKRSSGRMFPTCSEVLEVLRNLGYEKRPAAPPAASSDAHSGAEPVGATEAAPNGQSPPSDPNTQSG